MKTFFLTILAIISISFAHGEDLEPMVNLLLREVRGELTKGWTASYDKKYAWLAISREEAVSSFSTLPNGPPDEKPEMTKFVFPFRIMAAIPPNEHRRLMAENAQIQREANTLYEDLKRRGLQQKFDSFGWKTDDDKRDVARYEALKKSWHSLPEFYFRDISLRWEHGSPEFPAIDIIDERIREECRRVQKKVLKLLTAYEVGLSTR